MFSGFVNGARARVLGGHAAGEGRVLARSRRVDAARRGWCLDGAQLLRLWLLVVAAPEEGLGSSFDLREIRGELLRLAPRVFSG